MAMLPQERQQSEVKKPRSLEERSQAKKPKGAAEETHDIQATHPEPATAAAMGRSRSPRRLKNGRRISISQAPATRSMQKALKNFLGDALEVPAEKGRTKRLPPAASVPRAERCPCLHPVLEV